MRFKEYLSEKVHRWFKGQTFYHGSDNTKKDLDPKFASSGKQDHPTTEFGLFFTPDRKVAESYGKHVFTVKIHCQKPHKIMYDEYMAFDNKNEVKKYKNKLIKGGYDSVILLPLTYPEGNEQIAVFKKEDIEILKIE